MKNFIFCTIGVLIGFFVGFLVANTMSQPPSAVQGARTSAGTRPQSASGEGSELPPNHPDISGLMAEGAPAADSMQARAAADAAEQNPRDFNAQLKAAQAFYDFGDYDKAVLYGERALKINAEDLKALVLVGNAKYDKHDYVGAATFYERALAKTPNDPDIRTDYGNTFFLRQPPDLDRALAEYRKSVAADPRHEKSWLNIASASIQKKDKTAALEALARVEAINPQNSSLPMLKQNAQAIQP